MKPETSSRIRPVLMLSDEIMPIGKAAQYARRNERTIRRWVKAYGIGRNTSRTAPLEISRPALDMVLHGDFETLERLHANERSHPDVARYFELAGLPSETG
jgi:hypothetical protein